MKDLFGAARAFICRVEVENNRLPFILLEAHRLSVLILECEVWCSLTLVNLLPTKHHKKEQFKEG